MLVDIVEKAGIHIHNSGNVLETKLVTYSFVPQVYFGLLNYGNYITELQNYITFINIHDSSTEW